MARRKPYTKVLKENQIREDHVKGMGDVVFKGFQCLQSDCRHFLFVKKDEIDEEFEFPCPDCGFIFRHDSSEKFYDYELLDKRDESIIEEGEFLIFHKDYIAEAEGFKYCIICNTIKPLSLFHSHSSRKSGRQGECILCKTVYNSIKNQTRLSDQHREAAQKRRLYIELAGDEKIQSKEVFNRFDYKCFKCGKDLSKTVDAEERQLDHTLPAYYFWPLTTQNATLLCKTHNNEKSGKWPSEYYTEEELKSLSVTTGFEYKLLSGDPQINPKALEKLQDSDVVDELLTKYSAYMDEIIKFRNRILSHTGLDFFEHATRISQKWIDKANEELK